MRKTGKRVDDLHITFAVASTGHDRKLHNPGHFLGGHQANPFHQFITRQCLTWPPNVNTASKTATSGVAKSVVLHSTYAPC